MLDFVLLLWLRMGRGFLRLEASYSLATTFATFGLSMDMLYQESSHDRVAFLMYGFCDDMEGRGKLLNSSD